MPQKLNPDSRVKLASEIGKLISRAAKRTPSLGVIDVNAALGLVAATVTVTNVAPGLPVADALAAEALALGFSEGLKTGRASMAS